MPKISSLSHCRLINGYIKTETIYKKKDLWINNLRRKLRQNGLPYLDSKGRQTEGRTIGDPCPLTCYYECSLNFDTTERIQIHRTFWSLNSKEKTEFYFNFVKQINKKRRTTKKNDSRRAYTFKYYFPLSTNNKSMQVCQRFFLQTIDVSSKVVYRVLKDGYESKF